MSIVSYECKKTPKRSSSYQGRSRPSQSTYQACYTQAEYQNTPPPNYQSAPPPTYQNAPPFIYQIPPSIYQNFPPTYQTPSSHYQSALATMLTSVKLLSASPSIASPSSSLPKYLPKLQSSTAKLPDKFLSKISSSPFVQNNRHMPPP